MDISFIAFVIFIFFSSTVHALLEIQIEGQNGWAGKLPTRIFKNWWTRHFTEVGHITGFHIFTVLFVLVFAHFPVLFVEQWTMYHEAFVLSFVFLHFVLEDFLWFVYNPAFGIKKFSRAHIWWHTHWFLGLPASYWAGVICGIALYFFAQS
ncbi:MAG: hypothetical protein WC495_06710 [Patescibacteria group bacterium]|jgi:hypothetical protein